MGLNSSFTICADDVFMHANTLTNIFSVLAQTLNRA